MAYGRDSSERLQCKRAQIEIKLVIRITSHNYFGMKDSDDKQALSHTTSFYIVQFRNRMQQDGGTLATDSHMTRTLRLKVAHESSPAQGIRNSTANCRMVW